MTAMLMAALLAVFPSWNPDNPTPVQVDRAATVTATATRGLSIQIHEPDVSPDPRVGLHGLPFAPDGLDDCDEMMFYAAQFGLPADFRRIGWRESNCRNEDVVRTFCCHGYWQMYTSLHLRDHRLGPRMHDCGVFSHHDLNSDVPIEKQRQACAARALFDVVGYSAWALTR